PTHQWFRTGPAVPGGQAEDLGRYSLRAGPRVPGRLPRPAADLRQAGRVVLALPRPPPGRARRRRSLPARPRQAPLSARLNARPVAQGPPGAGLVARRPAPGLVRGPQPVLAGWGGSHLARDSCTWRRLPPIFALHDRLEPAPLLARAGGARPRPGSSRRLPAP